MLWLNRLQCIHLSQRQKCHPESPSVQITNVACSAVLGIVMCTYVLGKCWKRTSCCVANRQGQQRCMSMYVEIYCLQHCTSKSSQGSAQAPSSAQQRAPLNAPKVWNEQTLVTQAKVHINMSQKLAPDAIDASRQGQQECLFAYVRDILPSALYFKQFKAVIQAAKSAQQHAQVYVPPAWKKCCWCKQMCTSAWAKSWNQILLMKADKASRDVCVRNMS